MISYSEILNDSSPREPAPASFSRNIVPQEHYSPPSEQRKIKNKKITTSTRVRSTEGRQLLKTSLPSSSHFDFTPGHSRYVGGGDAGRNIVRPMSASLRTKREYQKQALEVMRQQTGAGGYVVSTSTSSSYGDLHGGDSTGSRIQHEGHQHQQHQQHQQYQQQHQQQRTTTRSMVSSSSSYLEQGSSLHLAASFSPMRSQKKRMDKNRSPSLTRRRPRPQTASAGHSTRRMTRQQQQKDQHHQMQQEQRSKNRPRTASAPGRLLEPLSSLTRRSVGSSLFDRNNLAAETKLRDLRFHLRSVVANQKLERRREKEERARVQQGQQQQQGVHPLEEVEEEERSGTAPAPAGTISRFAPSMKESTDQFVRWLTEDWTEKSEEMRREAEKRTRSRAALAKLDAEDLLAGVVVDDNDEDEEWDEEWDEEEEGEMYDEEGEERVVRSGPMVDDFTNWCVLFVLIFPYVRHFVYSYFFFFIFFYFFFIFFYFFYILFLSSFLSSFLPSLFPFFLPSFLSSFLLFSFDAGSPTFGLVSKKEEN